MDQVTTVDKIDDIIGKINIHQEDLKKIGIESDHVYQAVFEQIYDELDKIGDRLFKISDELFWEEPNENQM